nr:unnamed protein product [Digitaria exilis]
MAPQLQGCYWTSSWPRVQQMPAWPRSSDSSRRRLLRLVPTRSPYSGAVCVVADADQALAMDGVADAVGVEFLTEEEHEKLDERERLRRMRISQANKGNTPWNKGRKHSPETLQRIRERTRIAMQDPKQNLTEVALHSGSRRGSGGPRRVRTAPCAIPRRAVPPAGCVARACAFGCGGTAAARWSIAAPLGTLPKHGRPHAASKPDGASWTSHRLQATRAPLVCCLSEPPSSPECHHVLRSQLLDGAPLPLVKKKLMNLGHAQSCPRISSHQTRDASFVIGACTSYSEETRVKISEGVRRGWSLRLQRLMVQDGCFVEWRDMVADAARKGFAGGVNLQWNSYKILTEQMRQEWLGNHQKRRSMPRPRGNRRAPKTPEQRRKIAEAIAAKWLNQEYRERVCNGIAHYHGSSPGTKSPRKPRPAEELGLKRETSKKKYLQARAVSLEDADGKGTTVKRKKSAIPYKDPMAGEKLEMLSKVRAQRAALEIEKKEATKRARSLIAEAEKASDALESAAAMSPFAQASLIEARKLVAEARVLLECVEGLPEHASDDISEDSALLEHHRGLETQNESNALKQESKPVNGTKLATSNVNGIGFHFDVSAVTGLKQLYQTIEYSMERAFLLPSALSKPKAVNGDFSIIDFQVRQSMANDMENHESIVAESTEPPGTLEEYNSTSAEKAETSKDCPLGTPVEDTPSEKKVKMRWVRGRLIKLENEPEDPEI